MYLPTKELVLLEPSGCVFVARSHGDIDGVQSPGRQCGFARSVSWLCFFRASDYLREVT